MYRNVIWLGDFNYRINMLNEDVRRLAYEENYQGLFAADQVSQCEKHRLNGGLYDLVASMYEKWRSVSWV
jgi:hypothetical protein